MNVAKNDITGDMIKSKTSGTKNFRNNYDAIFRRSSESSEISEIPSEIPSENAEENPKTPEVS